MGYVQVDGNQNDCLIVEAEMSNCAGSTPMYAIEAYILCHGAVEEISCRPDSSTGTIVASVVRRLLRPDSEGRQSGCQEFDWNGCEREFCDWVFGQE